MNKLKQFDCRFFDRKTRVLAGVDEAGRGPIAGPVVAASVIFDKKTFHKQINDSKKLNAKIRDLLFDWIMENCITYGIGIVDHEEIDRINILQASLKAMKQAVEQMNLKPDLVLIDGNKMFNSELKTKAIVKGDAKSFSIAAASIIAKVTRDRIMTQLSKEFPNYMWNHNKGYATKAHIEAIKKFGVSPLHRITFLNKILSDGKQGVLF
jgi:ribonuclease HII